MRHFLLITTILFLGFINLEAQYDDTEYGGYAIGVKGGLTVGLQIWNDNDSRLEPLLQYHGALSWESLNTPDTPFSVFAQLGYHIKGSSRRFRAFQGVIAGQTIDIGARSEKLKFSNVALILGGKKYFDLNNNDAYYMFGGRLEYTVRDTLQGFYFSSFSEDVRKFNYGVSIGGGIEFPFSDYINGFLELNISPDFSHQIFVPQGKYFYPQQLGNSTSEPRPFPQQKVRNISFEVSVGIRFQRIIEYIDD